MIKETIKVEYSISQDNGELILEKDMMKFIRKESIQLRNGEKEFGTEFNEHSYTFYSFKNNGEVSKTNRSIYDEVNREAERLLAKRLEIRKSTVADEKRGEELANIINDAYNNRNTNTEWVTIKEKTSHSKWYRPGNGGEFNAPSIYLTQVPGEVEAEARELQALRKKHQGDNTFDFDKTSYLTRIERVADHDNCSDDEEM